MPLDDAYMYSFLISYVCLTAVNAERVRKMGRSQMFHFIDFHLYLEQGNDIKSCEFYLWHVFTS